MRKLQWNYVYLLICFLGLLLLALHPIIMKEFVQSKRHRVFSKALLTDFHFPEDLNLKMEVEHMFKIFTESPDSFFSLEKSHQLDGTRFVVSPSFRSDRTEAILITAPKETKLKKSNLCGQAFAAVLYQHLKNAKYLSRDVVIAFSDSFADHEAMIKNYFNPHLTEQSSMHILPNNVIAAFNIEINGEFCSNFGSFKFAVEGNQLVPYMDMLNTLTKISATQGIKAEFDFPDSVSMSEKIPEIYQAYIRSFIGHLSSGHSQLLNSKVDAISVIADGDEDSEDIDGIQELHRFFMSSIRSFCNAIEHFEYESAVFTLLNGNDYYELNDVLLPGLLLISPFAIIALLELYRLWTLKSNQLELLGEAGSSVLAFMKVATICFIATQSIAHLPIHKCSSYIFAALEAVLILTIPFIVKPPRTSLMISSVVIFIACLVSVFTAFGPSVCQSAIALVCFTAILMGNSMGLVGKAMLPFSLFSFWLKALLMITKHDTFANIHTLTSNHFINLMILPALLLLQAPTSSIELQKQN